VHEVYQSNLSAESRVYWNWNRQSRGNPGASAGKNSRGQKWKGLTAHLGKPVDATALATLIEQLTAKRLERTAG